MIGLRGEGAESGFPEQALVIFLRAWEGNNSDSNEHLAFIECQPLF